MLTPYLPYPLSSGGQIRSYNLLKNLGKKHQITLVALIKHDSEKQYISNISDFCQKVIVAHRPERPWTLGNIVKTAFGLYPFLVVRNFSPKAKEKVAQELQKETFDLIHAETFYVMPHISETSVPILLVEQTIEYLVYRHYVEAMRWAPLRPIFSADVEKIHYWEEYYWKRAKRVVAMSEPDRQVMKSRIRDLDVSIVPNGVDCTFFKYKKRTRQLQPRILFVGNFKWLQNREAVIELVKKIWPLISSKLPQAHLWIVGRYPTSDILALRNENIEISDKIEDIREAYSRSDVLLAPIFGSGGTRYKILEAMACGVPVITTPQGIAGLGARDGNEALIHTSSLDLAEATVKVLQDSSLYLKLARQANQMVRQTYSWEVIAAALDQVYETVAHAKKN